VISAASFPLNHLFYPFQRRTSTPIVLLGSIHPEDAWGYERPSLLRLTRHAFSTVAHTDPERDWLLAHGAPQDRVRIIPLGIDPGRVRGAPANFRSRHDVPADAFVVTFLGQLAEHKGVRELALALPALLRSVPTAWLIIAGAPTPYSQRLRSVLASLPDAARSRVLLLEDVPDHDKGDLLADSDVFASPSRYESFGLTILEAWANGLPVVVGDTPAIRWVVGEAGVFVPPGDPNKLGEALVALACDKDLRARLAAAGRNRLEQNFTLERVVDAYLDLYLEAARVRASGP
jgi:glycosyltransferase involved in cell wall biosynthesis